MSGTTEFIHNAVYAVFFCTALSLMFLTFNSITSFCDEAIEFVTKIDVVSEDTTVYDDTVTYEQLIGEIALKPAYDFSVNGVLVPSVDFESDTYNYSWIPNKTYSRKVVLSSSGTIQQIVFVEK